MSNFEQNVTETKKNGTSPNAAKIAWNKTNVKQIKMNMVRSTDADIIAYLDSCDNVQGLIKSLLRAKMAQDGFVYHAEE